MKNSPLPVILVGVLLVSSLLNAILVYQHVMLSRELRQLQQQALAINNNRNLAAALATEAIEYSKRNAAIDPILESLNIKNRGGVQAPAAATKLPAR